MKNKNKIDKINFDDIFLIHKKEKQEDLIKEKNN